MQKSEDLSLLAKALLEAQKKRQSVIKDKDVKDRQGNLKHSYANLEQVLESTIPVYNECGIVVLQPHDKLAVGLLLLHESGQYIYFNGDVEVIPQLTREGTPAESWSMALGKAMTYARRYGLMGAMGITQTNSTNEDEGEAYNAQNQKGPQTPIIIDALKVLIAECGMQKQVKEWLDKKGIASINGLSVAQTKAWITQLESIKKGKEEHL